ncbi:MULTISPECIES: alpha-L-fucosidase [Sphingobacterium]|uniref:alpha-L-fucosidase n=1 Tax=Sphingobacterium TaxID=28453 RepID=UPI0013D9985A|nr:MULTISPECIES: alpha-L-fucosidase [unclassified Sphingobacterium]
MNTKNLLRLLLLSPLFSFAQKAPEPYGALPSARQLTWHEMEMYCLIHYTPTTFQDKEWGYGDADPKIFNPSHFDASQIAKAAASAGFKGLISVAKHHDGFCLWPTKTNSYNIAYSPWKDGKGDMVKEFMEASHAQGMAFGVYLSAWDRNDTRYGTPAYADAYRAQLKELMTGYGKLFTSWHDGANGGDGYYGGKSEKRTIDRTTYYAWEEKTWPIVRRYQPMAMIFSDIGPDMRWVGNEHGFAAETSWATITPKTKDGSKPVPGQLDDSNLPTGDRDGKYWIPAECDVPQRPGWFYHKNQDLKVKTPAQLFEIYLKSVGRGANMNLGLAPMPEGILHANDVLSLAAFGKKIEMTFSSNLAKNARATTSSNRGKSSEFALSNLFDDDRYSYYAPDEGVLNPVIEVTLPNAVIFDIIRLRENIKLGQRLDSVVVSVPNGDTWQRLASATSIGANRLIKLDQPVVASKLRVQLYAPVVPTLSDIGLFKEYEEPFSFGDSNVGLNKLGNAAHTLLSHSFQKAFDGDIYSSVSLKNAKSEVILRLKEPIRALGYMPRQDGVKEGMVTKYKVYHSQDGKKWQLLKTGEFSNIKANPTEQIITFDTLLSSPYLKFVPNETIAESFAVAEFNLYQ